MDLIENTNIENNNIEKINKIIDYFSYHKNYRKTNPEIYRKAALNCYYKNVSTDEGRLKYNETKRKERLNRKIKL